MIKAVIFDFFGVLVSEGFKKFCDFHFPNDPEKRRLATELVNRHDSGEITAKQFYADLAKLAGIEYTESEALNTNLPNRELLDYIRQNLKSKYKLGVLSNSGDGYIYRMLDKPDVGLFDDVVLSYEHQLIKPQPEIFDLAAKRLKVDPAECVFIDDSPKHCEAAQSLGMKAIWYQDFNQMKSELEKILATSSNN